MDIPEYITFISMEISSGQTVKVMRRIDFCPHRHNLFFNIYYNLYLRYTTVTINYISNDKIVYFKESAPPWQIHLKAIWKYVFCILYSILKTVKIKFYLFISNYWLFSIRSSKFDDALNMNYITLYFLSIVIYRKKF